MATEVKGYLEERFIKSVIVGAILLALIWVGNVYYFQQYQLPEPLFLRHNYKVNHNETYRLDLYYLVRENDDAQIIFLSFPAIDPSFDIYPVMQYDQQYTNIYRIKRVQLELNEELISSLDAPEILLEKANVTFNNGTVGTFNIGQILLHTESVPNHFSWQSAGSGSDNAGNSRFVANETIEVVGAEFTGDSELANISLNGNILSQDLFPFTVMAGRGLTIDYALEVPHDFQEFNYSQNLTLLTETENGESGQTHVKIDYFQLQINEIKKLLRERGEL